MRLVVDTNVLISALIARSTTYDIIVFGNLELLVPEYSLEEIERNRKELQTRMQIEDNEFFVALNMLLSHVIVVPREHYTEFEVEAKSMTPHQKDFTFFALALAKNIPLWSNEGRLKKQDK